MPIAQWSIRIGIHSVRTRVVTHVLPRVMTGVLATVLSGCSLNDLVKVDPATQQQVDADLVHTYSGSVSLYYGTINIAAQFAQNQAWMTGLMTDELQSASSSSTSNLDARLENELAASNGQAGAWPLLAATQRAIDALRQFPSQTPRAYLAELYALQGLAVVWMAEDYCSGVPLTKTPLTGNFTYTKGYTTTEILQHAVALFDTALAFGSDSARIVTLAKVGKGRAFMNMNQYDSAANAVAGVATDQAYVSYYITGIQDNAMITPRLADEVRVVNAEGFNGLRWLATSPALQDPRVPMTTEMFGDDVLFTAPVRQAKYTGTSTTLRLADGIEARLIEAEAALANNDTVRWAQLLNTLRTSAIVPAIPVLPADSTLLASPVQRVNLMFRERAYWLYLTGHRQGDLRRLIRQYGRDTRTVYPTGDYVWPAGERILYGDLVVFQPSFDEISRNPLYDGCFDRNP